MGKAKSRIFRKGINDQIPNISREQALKDLVCALNNNDKKVAYSITTLFGFRAEEILEAGANYESVIALKNLFTE